MKQMGIVALVAFALGLAIAKYYWPTVQTKVEVQEKEVVRTDIKTVIRTVERPDGTKETVTETVDKSVQQTNKQLIAQTAKQPQWNLGLSAGSQLREFGLVYGARVERRILGPVFAGVYGRTDGEFGLSIALEF